MIELTQDSLNFTFPDVHPSARLSLDILERPNAARLGQIAAAVGLASNLAALRALATEGIQRGHMSLHARAVALSAGAQGEELEILAKRLRELSFQSDRVI